MKMKKEKVVEATTTSAVEAKASSVLPKAKFTLGNPSSNAQVMFNSEMRKALVKGVLQDLKGYIESKTDGLVELSYEDFSLKGHEFGFRLFATRSQACKKQLFQEVCDAMSNAIDYMFPGECNDYDISFSKTSTVLEIEFVSNW